MTNKIEHWQLLSRQAQPLEMKIRMTQTRIRAAHDHWNGDVYVSYSGGMDSTVLLHIARELYPSIPAVFIKSLPYPEIWEHVQATPGVTVLRPKKTFPQIVREYGWPIVSKENSQKIYEVRTTKSDKLRRKRMHGDNTRRRSGKIPDKWMYLIDAPFKISDRCCYWMKKSPAQAYQGQSKRYPVLGARVQESRFRLQSYIRHGCNALDVRKPRSWPLAFWRDEDIWEYVRQFSVPYSRIYDMGYKRTGCFPCAFGAHMEKEPNRYQRMKSTHPKLHEWCGNLGLWEVLEYIGVPHE